MSFDLDPLRAACTAHGNVARLVVTDTRGSAPREAGTAMLVWADGQSGTIGGGTLEYRAVAAARALLEVGGDWPRQARTLPLGPELGQCCGGSVSLLTEIFSNAALDKIAALDASYLSRPAQSGIEPRAGIVGGKWFSEPLAAQKTPVWIWGAGHVGRALVDVLGPLDCAITMVDFDAARFSPDLPEDVTALVVKNPADAVPYAPPEAHHLIATYSHQLDLDLCHRILSHGFDFAGLIGSATKWARFRKRLAALGHSEAQIARITCPIGDPGLGKAPHAIAVGVAMEFLRRQQATRNENRKEIAS